MNVPASAGRGWVARLHNFARRTDEVQCELCGAPILYDHPHLFEVAKRKLYCCCRACALLFGNQQGTRYRPVTPPGVESKTLAALALLPACSSGSLNGSRFPSARAEV